MWLPAVGVIEGNLVYRDMECFWKSPAHSVARKTAYLGASPHCLLSCRGDEGLHLPLAVDTVTWGNL
jgi:hypothetical protein